MIRGGPPGERVFPVVTDSPTAHLLPQETHETAHSMECIRLLNKSVRLDLTIHR